VRPFNLSNDPPRFVDKLCDTVDLHPRPVSRGKESDSGAPPHAARRATEKGLAGATRDHEGRGLIEATNVLDGSVIGRNMKRQRHQEFIRFLDLVEGQVLVGKFIPAIVDNYVSHEHPDLGRWLERYGRWTIYFTPTSRFWLNDVAGSFASLTKRRLKAAPSGPSTTFKPRSTASSKSRISDPGHSLGPPIEKSLPMSGT
jgi:hypothetical protein